MDPIRRPGREPVQLTAAVTTALVIIATLALILVGNVVYDAARADTSSRTVVTARLLEDAGPPVVVPRALPVPPRVRAHWTAPDGTTRTGPVQAKAFTPAGTTISVWTDPAGNPTRAPASPDEATTRAAQAVVLAGLSRRYAQIDREREQVEPAWAHRYR